MSTTTAPEPTLTRSEAPSSTRAVVLALHGGTQWSWAPVDDRSASWRRMAAMQRSITPALHAEGVGTWLLRYRYRGWNDHGHEQVDDARWALAEVRRHHGDVPVVLLGHSMGGRTACHVADEPGVVGAVVLAPWLPEGEAVSALAGKHLRAAHGRSDRITSPRATAAYVGRAERVAASATLTDMGRVGHYMFRRASAWNAFATSRVLELLG